MDVDAAGISVKVDAHYPGRSVDLPSAIDFFENLQDLAFAFRTRPAVSEQALARLIRQLIPEETKPGIQLPVSLAPNLVGCSILIFVKPLPGL